MIPIGDEIPVRKTPVVTYALIAVNTVVLLFSLTGGLEAYEAFIYRWGFVPARFRVVTLLTSMFLHGGVFHLGGNMLFLWIFGDNVEDILGRVPFLLFYLVMGVLATLGHYLYNVDSMEPLVGASGAIAGVLGAHMVFLPWNRVKILFWWYFYVRIFWVRAGWALGIYFALQVVYAAALSQYSNVAFWAHVAGFAAGAVVALLLLALDIVKRPGRPQAPAGIRSVDVRRIGPESGGAGGLAVTSSGATIADWMETGSGGRGGDFAEEASQRIKALLAAVESGSLDDAVKRARHEMRLRGARAADMASLVSVADALYGRKVYRVAFELYQAAIMRGQAGDHRLGEVKLRAGMTASRHLHDFGKARKLLEEAAESHPNSERRAIARRELAAVEANLDRTSIDSEDMLLSGPCAVIRQTGGRVNVAEIGRLVSKETGAALADVTRLLKSSVGFVAQNVDAVKAKKLAVTLQEMGIAVLIVPMEKLVALPAAQTVRWAAVTGDGVFFRTDVDAREPVGKGWNDVFYSSAGMVSITTQRRVHDSTAPPDTTYVAGGGMGLGLGMGVRVSDGSSRWQYKDEKKEIVVFDVFTLNPFACYRCMEENMSFRDSPQGTSHSLHLNFVQLISDFLAMGTSVPCNEGVGLIVADAPQMRWRGLSFNSIRDFEQYNYWRLQLEQYG